MKQLFFVYGSLKSGHWNNAVLGGSKLVATAITKANYLLTDVGFPYMIPENAHTAAAGHPTRPVVGEVYEVTCEGVEASLDALEGRGRHYDRHEVEVIDTDTGDLMKVQTYIPCDMGGAAQYKPCKIEPQHGTECYEWS